MVVSRPNANLGMLSSIGPSALRTTRPHSGRSGKLYVAAGIESFRLFFSERAPSRTRSPGESWSFCGSPRPKSSYMPGASGGFDVL